MQMMPQAQAAQQVNDRFVSLVKDLSATSAQDPAAAQVLSEFKIQFKDAPSTATAPAAAK